MDILATAAAHLREHAALLARNGFDAEDLVTALHRHAENHQYNPETSAAIEVGSRIYRKGSLMNGTRTRGRVTTIVVHSGQNPDGNRLEALGLNLSGCIAYGADPLPIR